jgi:hypothetical protein
VETVRVPADGARSATQCALAATNPSVQAREGQGGQRQYAQPRPLASRDTASLLGMSLRTPDDARPETCPGRASWKRSGGYGIEELGEHVAESLGLVQVRAVARIGNHHLAISPPGRRVTVEHGAGL